MNINKIPVTNDLQEQIAIGFEIMETYEADKIDYMKSVFMKVKNWESRYPISIDEMMAKATYDYWMYGFSPADQIYFHLLNKTHEEKKSFLSNNNELLYFAHLNAKKDMNLMEDKWEAYKLLKPYYKREMIKISTEEDYPLFLDFISRHPQFVLKPLGLHDTLGVEPVDSTKHEDKKELFNSMLHVGESFTGDYTTRGWNHNSAVLEEFIIQDPAFGEMSPKSLNGVRIPTFRVNGEVHVYGCWLKVGVTDNLIVGESRDAILAGIDCKTGVLNTNGFYENGDETETHPVCGIKIKGWQVPKWQELLDFIKKAANELPKTINYVGWDACLTHDGWVLVEGNYYGQALWQLVEQKGMKEELGNLIGWHMDENKPWWRQKTKQIEKEAGLLD